MCFGSRVLDTPMHKYLSCKLRTPTSVTFALEWEDRDDCRIREILGRYVAGCFKLLSQHMLQPEGSRLGFWPQQAGYRITHGRHTLHGAHRAVYRRNLSTDSNASKCFL
jgi:hypothetical protein